MINSVEDDKLDSLHIHWRDWLLIKIIDSKHLFRIKKNMKKIEDLKIIFHKTAKI